MKLVLFLGFVLVFLLVGSVGYAQEYGVPPQGGSGVEFPNPLKSKCGDFGCVADKIISGLYKIAVPIVAIMVLVGGFQILTAGGDPEKFKKGKQTIFYAVIGLVAIILAGAVVGIIQSAFGG